MQALMDDISTGGVVDFGSSVVDDLAFHVKIYPPSGCSVYATTRLSATRNPQGERHDASMHYFAVMCSLDHKGITLSPEEAIESDAQTNLAGTRRGKPALELGAQSRF